MGHGIFELISKMYFLKFGGIRKKNVLFQGGITLSFTSFMSKFLITTIINR